MKVSEDMRSAVGKLALALLMVGALASDGRSETAGPRRSAAAQRESLLMVLGAREPLLVRLALDRIGPDVPRLLIDIASHPAERSTVRARALKALALYPGPNVRDFLGSLLHEPTLSGNVAGNSLRSEAVRSLGRGFGESAIDAIAALRGDTAPGVREAVALALGDTGSERAKRILEAWISLEPTIVVREAIDKGLLRLRGF